jgi:acyl dehydratase
MVEKRTIRTVQELEELVSQELGVSPWLEITQERVDAFADVTEDHQYIHVDPARAAQTPFGGTIAHGYLTLSLLTLLSRQLDGIAVDLQPRMLVNYGLNRVRFISPVRVGKRVRLRSRLLAVKQLPPDACQLTYEQTMELEGEQRPAMVAETIVRQYL